MAEVLSKSAFAARRGVGPSTVTKWIARGHITGVALTEDGRIRVAEAERQLAGKLDPAISSGRMAGPVPAQPSEPLSLREQLLAVELERKRRRLEVERGVYVRRTDLAQEYQREWQRFLAMVEQSGLPALARSLGLDKTGTAVVRAWWRGLRQTGADDAESRAAGRPQFVADNERDRGDTA